MATKTATAAATKTAAAIDYAEVGRFWVEARRLEREHAEITALDPSRGDVAFSRGELTKARDVAVAAARAAADAIIDGGE
jgi:hypothetical protein